MIDDFYGSRKTQVIMAARILVVGYNRAKFHITLFYQTAMIWWNNSLSLQPQWSTNLQMTKGAMFLTKRPGARFSKVLVRYRARSHILKLWSKEQLGKFEYPNHPISFLSRIVLLYNFKTGMLEFCHNWIEHFPV